MQSGLKMFQNGLKLYKMVQNGQFFYLSKTVVTCQNDMHDGLKVGSCLLEMCCVALRGYCTSGPYF